MPDLRCITEIAPDEKTLREWLTKIWGLPNPAKTKQVTDCTNHEKLCDDYVAIFQFLQKKKSVIDGLEPLNKALEQELITAASADYKGKVPADLKAKVTGVRHDPSAYADGARVSFKTHKVLSTILERDEQANLFNNATKELRKLHTAAQTAVGPEGWKDYNVNSATKRDDLPDISLPTGAPTLTNVLVNSFNPVLLRNGYHWKDPGADAKVHGEFTHRLQWYAICKAHKLNALKLTNTPVQIFKSMGYYPWPGGSNQVNESAPKTTVYLWQLLCDCFGSGQTTDDVNQPVSSTFHNPCVLQTYLCRPKFGKANDFSEIHDLPYLHVFMRARLIKRQNEESDQTAHRIATGKKTVKFGVTSPKDYAKSSVGQGQIWWRYDL